jgi:unsaturated chondroitin disaccharide hydrolase
MKSLKKYRNKSYLFIAIFITATIADAQNTTANLINSTLKKSALQYRQLAKTAALDPTKLPRTFQNNSVVMADPAWWTSGFFPGTLWYLYEASKDTSIKTLAEQFSTRAEGQKYTTNNHDVGFMIYCPFGNALRLSPKKEYKEIIIQAAKSLATRFNPKIGLIKSWDDKPQWSYPVIIDNMMNLELLCAASQLSGDKSFYNIAIKHADVTLENHFRANNSCYHVVSYDTLTGKANAKQTWQGLNDESEWSRGQSWAIYGYTMMYRMTKQKKYLDQAVKVAEYLINHPRMPKDMIPYWDFNDPKTPNALRDSSAGAVICSALIELSQYVPAAKSKKYLAVAEKQIRALCSPAYLANENEQGGFILKHGVGFLPHNSEVDVPLTYGDYYFIEALLRYKKHLNNEVIN